MNRDIHLEFQKSRKLLLKVNAINPDSKKSRRILRIPLLKTSVICSSKDLLHGCKFSINLNWTITSHKILSRRNCSKFFCRIAKNVPKNSCDERSFSLIITEKDLPATSKTNAELQMSSPLTPRLIHFQILLPQSFNPVVPYVMVEFKFRARNGTPLKHIKIPVPFTLVSSISAGLK